MKITESQLRSIIKESLLSLISETKHVEINNVKVYYCNPLPTLMKKKNMTYFVKAYAHNGSRYAWYTYNHEGIKVGDVIDINCVIDNKQDDRFIWLKTVTMELSKNPANFKSKVSYQYMPRTQKNTNLKNKTSYSVPQKYTAPPGTSHIQFSKYYPDEEEYETHYFE